MIKNIKEFVVDAAGWGVTSMLAALVSLGIAVWEHSHDKPVSSFLFVCLSVPLFWIGSYVAWAKKKRALETETDKSEAAPDIHVELPKGVSYMGRDRTIHLFLDVILTLRNPKKVLVSGFQLFSMFDGKNVDAKMVDDVDKWERLTKRGDFGCEHISLNALSKELYQRGSPVEGWLHFAINSLPSDLGRSKLQLRVNSAHGTCIGEIVGSHVLPHKESDVMRQKNAAQRSCSSFRSTSDHPSSMGNIQVHVTPGTQEPQVITKMFEEFKKDHPQE